MEPPLLPLTATLTPPAYTYSWKLARSGRSFLLASVPREQTRQRPFRAFEAKLPRPPSGQFTVCVTVPELLRKFAFPAYVALIVCVPFVSVEVVYVAMPPTESYAPQLRGTVIERHRARRCRAGEFRSNGRRLKG